MNVGIIARRNDVHIADVESQFKRVGHLDAVLGNLHK